MSWNSNTIKLAAALALPVLSFSMSAAASGPQPPAFTLPNEKIEAGASPGALLFSLNSNDVEDIEVESTILDARGKNVGKTRFLGTTIIHDESSGSRLVEADDGFVLAGRGDTLALKSPHELSRELGVYCERVLIRVSIIDQAATTDSLEFRCFRVTRKGVSKLSGSAYSKLTDPLHRGTDRHGRVAMYHLGGGSRNSGGDAPKERGDVGNARLVESGHNSQSDKIDDSERDER